MQGKLVPQNPKDQPASELLSEIEAEKKRLVKQGKLREPKPLPPVRSDEMPYALPKGWEWVRLGGIGTWKSGTTPNRSNPHYYGGLIPWVKSGEVKQGHIRTAEETITEAALRECSLHINPIGSLLVAMYGANIGEIGMLEIEATTNQAVCACQPFLGIDKNFLFVLLLSLKMNFISQGAGAAQPNISREKIVTTMAPLPPAAEQTRIIAKIDELMAICDTIERQMNAAKKTQSALLDAMMAQYGKPQCV
jgi:restriction endonuclease S subunit